MLRFERVEIDDGPLDLLGERSSGPQAQPQPWSPRPGPGAARSPLLGLGPEEPWAGETELRVPASEQQEAVPVARGHGHGHGHGATGSASSCPTELGNLSFTRAPALGALPCCTGRGPLVRDNEGSGAAVARCRATVLLLWPRHICWSACQHSGSGAMTPL